MQELAEGRIRIARDGPVALVLINAPEKRNALDLAMWEALDAGLKDLAEADDLRVLVVAGTGGQAFASGADISRFAEERGTPEAAAHYGQVSGSVYARLEEFPRPSIAAIQGACIGGGLALATCCDIRICDAGARFGVPAARLGLGYGVAAQKRLSDLVGASTAADLLFTARQFGANEALRMALVSEVIDADSEVGAAAMALAGQIARNAPLTLAAAKAIRRAIATGALDADRDRLEAMVAACFASEDYAEGRAAFAEKRPPEFNGR